MRGSVVLGVLLVLASDVSCAQAAAREMAGIYSDLTYNNEGGDLLGMELMVVPAPTGYTVFVQIAEGDLQVASVVPLTVTDTRVSFTLPSGGAYGGMHFEGQWRGSLMIIHLPSGKEETLRRGKSYWQ